MTTNQLLYIGGDEHFLTALEVRLAPHHVRVYVTGNVCLSLPGWDSLYTVVLDCDGFDSPIDQFDLVRSSHPHAPIILLDRMRKNPLGYVASAKLHGAESFHWKPIHDWPRLLLAIDNAFTRLQRWQQLLIQVEEDCAAAPLGGQESQSPSCV